MWDGVTEPPDALKTEIATTGLTLYVDTNFIGDDSSAAESLRRCRAEGWVSIQRTDVMDTELSNAATADQQRLLDESANLPETWGFVVLDHSRLDHAVLGTPSDTELVHTIFRILSPNKDFASARRNDVRDAMHLACVVRYAGNVFVTRDRRVLNKREPLARQHSVEVMTPEEALERVQDAIRGVIESRRHGVFPGWIPSWTPWSDGAGQGAV